jgi:hypothetical protein
MRKLQLLFAFLNLDNVSRLRTERLRLFHSLTVAGTKESLVKESLQNGTIISPKFVMNKKKDYNITPYIYSDFCQLIFTNTEYLYRETGWERLEERRTRRKLQLF